MNDGEVVPAPVPQNRQLSREQTTPWKDEDYYLAIPSFIATRRLETTQRTYRAGLGAFFEVFLKSKVSPQHVTGRHVAAFIVHLKALGVADSTINNYLAAGSSFYRYLMKQEDVRTGEPMAKANPFKGVDRFKVNPYEHARKMDLETFQKILATCDRSTLMGKRDYAILQFYVWNARRRSEIAGARVRDLQEEGGQWYFTRRRKGQKITPQEVVSDVVEAVKDYWAASGRQLASDSPIFVAMPETVKRGRWADTGQETPISGTSVMKMLKRRAEEAGVSRDVCIHGIRHLAADLQYKITKDVRKVQEQLGHSNLNTTQIYLKSGERVVEEHADEKRKLLNG